MSGSILGDIFKLSTWGESHGKALGVVVDGCPAGLEISEEDIQKDLDRRKPGQSPFATPRKEGDKVEILSGVFEGKTTGTPISLIIYNKNQRSKDYSALKDVYRPGQSDYSYDLKYGFRDHRGSGRASGRETAARVSAGAIAKKLLAVLGVEIRAYTSSIGPVEIDSKNYDEDFIMGNFLYMPDREALQEAESYLRDLIQKNNSAGFRKDSYLNHLWKKNKF